MPRHAWPLVSHGSERAVPMSYGKQTSGGPAIAGAATIVMSAKASSVRVIEDWRMWPPDERVVFRRTPIGQVMLTGAYGQPRFQVRHHATSPIPSPFHHASRIAWSPRTIPARVTPV